MTKETMALKSLVEKSSDTDLLREMIGFAAERLMELEVGAATGAGYGEKNSDRLAQRNGYRDRAWGEAEKPTLRWKGGPPNARRERRAADPEAAHRLVLPELPGAATDGGE